MSKRHFYERFETADLSTTPNFRVYSKGTTNKNINLLYARAWLVVYENPTFTDIYFRIYSWNGSSPQKLLTTSTNAITKATLLTGSNTSAVRETYFTFNNFNMKSTDEYCFVPVATGYTGTTSSHLGWKKAFPDPVYPLTGYGSALAHKDLGRSSYCLYLVGEDL